ncbi:MAG: META domain-containing protein [Acidimicrobiales bacterium]|nr:MAG: META domain-containing protein [Acidimicrobiales bacterium]
MYTRKLAILIAASVAACAPTTSGAGAEDFNLAGSEWGLESGAHVPFIQFTGEGKAVGNGGCNRFSGSYEQTGNQISFGRIMSTKMACLELDQENAFFQALDQTRSFRGDHLKLVLMSDTGDTLLTLNRRDWD